MNYDDLHPDIRVKSPAGGHGIVTAVDPARRTFEVRWDGGYAQSPQSYPAKLADNLQPA